MNLPYGCSGDSMLDVETSEKRAKIRDREKPALCLFSLHSDLTIF
jgi:hypothetical protein